MQYKTLEQLERRADVHRDSPTVHQAMSRVERLGRWAQLLERQPHRRLYVLWETEYQPSMDRASMRCDDSALTVAFEDPAFRAAGLADDTFQTAKRFFSLSDRQLHEIVCSCRFERVVEARYAAAAVRRTVPRPSGPGVFSRMLRFLGF